MEEEKDNIMKFSIVNSAMWVSQKKIILVTALS